MGSRLSRSLCHCDLLCTVSWLAVKFRLFYTTHPPLSRPSSLSSTLYLNDPYFSAYLSLCLSHYLSRIVCYVYIWQIREKIRPLLFLSVLRLLFLLISHLLFHLLFRAWSLFWGSCNIFRYSTLSIYQHYFHIVTSSRNNAIYRQRWKLSKRINYS